MTAKHLKGSKPIVPPTAARAMYARNKTVIPWTDEREETLLRQFRRLKDIWKHNPTPDNEWDTPEPFVTPSGKTALEGQCNDFARALKRSLIVAGFPEQALSLVKCRYDEEGHMVLAVETDRGTLICCNIVDCWDLGSPALKHHEWLSWEAPGRPWESLEPIDLGDIWPS